MDNNNMIITRINRLRSELSEKDINAALITKPENYFYLSGFTGSNATLVITQQKAILLTDSRYTEQASMEAKNYEVIQVNGNNTYELINDILLHNNLRSLAFEDEYMIYANYIALTSKCSSIKFVPFKNTIIQMRSIKEAYEIEKIKKAVLIADDAFSHILNYIRPGISEIEVASEIEYFIRKQGAKGVSFETIVASGNRSSMPHAVTSTKKIEIGDQVILDFGVNIDNYCSDMTRTIFVGEPKDTKIKKIYNIVLEAQLAAINGAISGMLCKDVDKIARDIISSNSYGENFGHGLGHGVGIEVHEMPRVSYLSHDTLENGMVITIEPGIYISGFGGVRIEDMIVIRDDKPLVLTKSTKDIIII